MKPPPQTKTTSDNGEREDYLVVVTIAIYAAMKGLDAPIELLASKIKATVEGAP